ncbi:14547_t:CDS:2, partial [Gigaspora margarita]
AARQEDLSNETIETNLRILKGNLKKSEVRYTKPLQKIIESEEILNDISVGILKTLGEIWKNPKFAKTQSEGTYVADIIVPIIRAKLKICQLENLCTLAPERQSLASKDRRGERGERPDIMFIAKYMDRIYELMFSECSRIVCNDTKEVDDRVAGQKFDLYVLIREEDNISRLFLLRSVIIPIQHTNDIFDLIEALLLLRRILIVDLSLLFNSGINDNEDSSTVFTP